MTEFYANETIWPSGPGSNGRSVAVITVSYQDGGVLRSPAGYQVLLNNCGNQLAPPHNDKDFFDFEDRWL